jgi:hypothetical protein
MSSKNAINADDVGRLRTTLASGTHDANLLLYACQRRDVSAEIVDELLKHGADIDVTDYQGFAPIHYAVRNNRVDIVQLLLAAGDDINHPTTDATPLLLACEDLLDDRYEPFPVRLQLVNDLIDLGADVRSHGSEAMFYAIASGNDTLVTTLIEKGANPNASAGDRMSPIQIVISRLDAVDNVEREDPDQDVRVIEALLRAGADIMYRSPEYGTALEMIDKRIAEDTSQEHVEEVYEPVRLLILEEIRRRREEDRERVDALGNTRPSLSSNVLGHVQSFLGGKTRRMRRVRRMRRSRPKTTRRRKLSARRELKK